MGVRELRKYIRDERITQHAPKEVNSRLSFAQRPNHLLVDMNAVLHVAYTKATKRKTRATLQSAQRQLLEILQHVKPMTTLVLVFDGVAPLAKIPTQKRRRKHLPARPPDSLGAATSRQLSPDTSSLASSLPCKNFFSCDIIGAEVPLQQEEISAGSEFVYACEEYINAFLHEMEVHHHVLATWKTRWMCRSTQPGEGELKISHFIRRIWEGSVQDQTYSPEDTFVIAGNDSDLILVALLATPYRYLTIMDPHEFTIICIHKLLERWSHAVPNRPLEADQLASYRIDFVFLMLLAGCDYYEGVRHHVLELWKLYCDLRFEDVFANRKLIKNKKFELDVGFLRQVVRRKGPGTKHAVGSKNKRARMKATRPMPSTGSIERGNELLRAALWSLKGYVLGRCVDYEFSCPALPPSKNGLEIADLHAAVHRHGVAGAIGAAPVATEMAKNKAAETLVDLSTEPAPTRLSVLEQYVSILGIRGRYSKELSLSILRTTQDGGLKFTMSQAPPYLVRMVKMIMSDVNKSRLSEAERALHSPSTWQEQVSVNGEAEMTFSVIPRSTVTSAV